MNGEEEKQNTASVPRRASRMDKVLNYGKCRAEEGGKRVVSLWAVFAAGDQVDVSGHFHGPRQGLESRASVSALGPKDRERKSGFPSCS